MNVKKYNYLPEYVREEIEMFERSKKKFQANENIENKQQMMLDYMNMYTAIKHCVVNGVISASKMEELISELKKY